MEIEQITRDNGQKEWFIRMKKEEAFDIAQMILDAYRRKNPVSFGIHNDFEWFNFSVYPQENNAP